MLKTRIYGGISLGKREIWPLYMLIPPMIFLALLYFYPLGMTFYYSFTNFSVFSYDFVGLYNYVKMFSTPLLLETIVRTFGYMAFVIFCNFWLGMALALITYREFRGSKILRAIFLSPMLFIPAASADIWILMYDKRYGLINHFLEVLGFSRRMFLAEPAIALWCVMIADIWAWTPFMYIILLAGLQTIPKEPLEAAELDGASPVRKFFYVTLPLMKPVVAVGLVIKALDTFKTFTYVWVMTAGGPGYSTMVLTPLIFKVSFEQFKFGYGAAHAVIAFLCSLVLAGVLYKMLVK